MTAKLCLPATSSCVRMLCPFVFALLSCLGSARAFSGPQPHAVSAQTLKLPDGPGSVRGLAESATLSGFSGQLEYAIALELPRGVGGQKPQLSISYSGSLGNGPLGLGFALALPEVRRSDRKGVPSFGATDELELHGFGEPGRLVAAGDGTWRVEGKGQRFKVLERDGGFVLYTDDGTRHELGVSPATRQADGTRTTAWLVQTQRNVAGDVIRYAYVADAGALYPSQISWGPRDAFAVRVHLEDRPDACISYRSGLRVATAKRVHAIDVEAWGERVRTYHLAYDVSTGMSRLAGVRMTGRAGEGELPALTFTYAEAQRGQTLELRGTEGWVLEERGVSFADIDGDALPDLLRAEASGHSYRRNLGAGSFAAPGALPGGKGLPLESVRLADLDGDARPEIVRVVGDTWRASPLAASGWQRAAVVRGSLAVPLLGAFSQLADVNGDGRSDVLEDLTEGLRVYMLGASGFAAPVGRPPIDARDAELLLDSPYTKLADVNGDGLVDVVALRDGWLTPYLGRGDGTFERRERVLHPWAPAALDPEAVFLVDLDRNGLVDLLRVVAGHVEYYRGRPGPSFAAAERIARPTGADHDARVAFADVLGDGSDDLVWSSAGRLWALDFAGVAHAGMVTAIDNGLGMVTRYDYMPTAQLARRDEQAGATWSVLLPSSITVVVRTETAPGPDEPARVLEYAPRDGFWDRVEDRFGGFLTSVERALGATPATTRVTESRFEAGLADERVLRGKTRSVRTSDASGRVFSEETTQHLALPVAGLPSSALTRVAVVGQVLRGDYEGKSTPLETLKTYVHDPLGRTIEEREHGRTDRDGDERVTLRTFADDEQTWVRDRVCEQTVTDGAGRVVERLQTFYGDSSAQHPLCVVGAGWLREERGFLPEESRWITRKAQELDAHGNVVVSLVGGVRTSFSYDADGLHPREERLAVDAGTQLVYRADWDEVLGELSAVTDPAGVTSHIARDALGRVTALSIGDAPAHTRYAYAWSLPRPRTTTLRWDGPLAAVGDESAPGWRESVRVSNGAGETLYEATRLAEQRWSIAEATQRDSRGQVVFVAEPYHSSTPPGGSVVDARIGTRVERDALGRELLVTGPTASSELTVYEPLAEVQTTDGLAPVRRERDGLGRIVHTERRVNGTLEMVDGTYDAQGRVLSLSLQGGRVVHRFVFDGLGRLVHASDPDAGPRELEWDDGDRLTSHENALGQRMEFSYDAVGRLSSAHEDGRLLFAYHYDRARDGSVADGTRGRLAWVEEPEGDVAFAYDALGRIRRRERRVASAQAMVELSWSASGLLLAERHDDGFALERRYDRGGRALSTGALWAADELDAAGRSLAEHAGNGVITRTERNERGWVTGLLVSDAQGEDLVALEVEHTPWGALDSVTDSDHAGLDHSARFQYDAGGRLESARLGGANGYSFGYRYDGLQNLLARTVSGPAPLRALSGDYEYGAPELSPRRLTAVRAADGSRTAIAHDAAGRITHKGEVTNRYDAFDRLLAVSTPQGSLRHEYGHDGLHTLTRHDDGSEELWFAEDVEQRAGVRRHHVRVENRVVATVSVVLPGVLAQHGRPAGSAASTAFVLAAAALALAFQLRGRRRLAYGSGLTALALIFACTARDGVELAGTSQTLASAESTLFMHEGLVAGPLLVTDETGAIAEERLHEPFGVPIAAADYEKVPFNELGKTTDAATGWSFHGARWLAPELATWLAPDPAVKAPDPKLMEAPWDLHPYSYVRQSPTAFWDPDGMKAASKHAARFASNMARAYAHGERGIARDLSIHVDLSPKPQPKRNPFTVDLDRQLAKEGFAPLPPPPEYREPITSIGENRGTGLTYNPADRILQGLNDHIQVGNNITFILHAAIGGLAGNDTAQIVQNAKLTSWISDGLSIGGINTTGVLGLSQEHVIDRLRPPGGLGELPHGPPAVSYPSQLTVPPQAAASGR